MAVIDKSITNNYYFDNSKLVAAIDRLTDAVKDLKPSPNDPETDPRYAEALQREKEIVQAIKGIYEP